MSNHEQTPDSNANGNVGEQIPHSGVRGIETPHREFDNTPLSEAPLDVHPHEVHDTSVLPEDLQVVDKDDPAYWANPDRKAQTTTTTPDGLRWYQKRGVKVAGVALGLAGAGAAYLGIHGNSSSNGDNNTEHVGKKDGESSLIMGPDGSPKKYIEYKEDSKWAAVARGTSGEDPGPVPASMDRNHDGQDDATTDVNEDGIPDYKEMWNQLDNRFENANKESDQETLANASEQDIADMAEIEEAIPGFWGKADTEGADAAKARFVRLDPVVKRYIMLTLRSPEDFDSRSDWAAGVANGFNMTADDIENNN